MPVRSLEGRTCAHCDKALTGDAPKRGPLPVYCGRDCRNHAQYARASEWRARIRAGLACERCSTPLGAIRWRKRFCGKLCCTRARRARKKEQAKSRE